MDEEKMTKVTQTSLEAFKSIRKELGRRQQEVYETIKKIGPCNNLMIAKYLNLPINSVVQRVNELRNKKKLVGFAFTSKCPYTGRNSNFWKVVR